MLPKDDVAFKKVVDGAMIATYKSGEINKIYDKWFTQPIPPKNINLNAADELGAEEGDRQSDVERRSEGLPVLIVRKYCGGVANPAAMF